MIGGVLLPWVAAQTVAHSPSLRKVRTLTMHSQAAASRIRLRALPYYPTMTIEALQAASKRLPARVAERLCADNKNSKTKQSLYRSGGN